MPFNVPVKPPKGFDPKTREKFIGFVGCGKAKLSRPAPARDLYTGPLTRMGIEWMDRNCRVWHILSAKYGILAPNKITKPYNVKMSDHNDAAIDVWDELVAEQLSDGILDADRPFLFLAGRDYTERFGYLDHSTIVCQGMKMGHRMQWLKNNPWLTKDVLKEIAGG